MNTQTQRQNGHYQGPLKFQWSPYSLTLRVMPSNYLAADLNRIDGSLGGRENEIGQLIAEAPAMLEALRAVLPYLKGTESFAETEAAIRAILARIDGPADDLAEAAAGDTCTACRRASYDCSRAPCAAVVSDREA